MHVFGMMEEMNRQVTPQIDSMFYMISIMFFDSSVGVLSMLNVRPQLFGRCLESVIKVFGSVPATFGGSCLETDLKNEGD